MASLEQERLHLSEGWQTEETEETEETLVETTGTRVSTLIQVIQRPGSLGLNSFPVPPPPPPSLSLEGAWGKMERLKHARETSWLTLPMILRTSHL